jgi:methylated-DNA-[protein]-cysteine S-methyltransferase
MTYARDEARIATPIGIVHLIGDDVALESVRICPDEDAVSRGTADAVRSAAEQVERWFAGELQIFDVPLAPAKTPRGGALRQGVIDISYGDTVSYGELARRLGSSARAIGQACARNPFPLIVPCHRVTAGGGALGHYSGGNGRETKRWLLDFERKWRGEDLL